MTGRDDWQLRPAITATIGLVAAVAIQQLVDRIGANGAWMQPEAGRVALATAVGVAAILAIFTLERVRWAWSAGFAIGVGCVAGLVTWWSGPLSDSGEFVGWRTACLFLAIAIAAPLFQAARDAGRARFDYVEVHGHVWTNIILWGAACAFTGIAFALTYLLSALFSLIGIHVLRDLLEHGWANAALFGAAFGGAAGLFRERDAVVRTLHRVVTAVLGVLAPVLGAGLLLFLIALPFTGLGALWEATKATTPILLACVIGALVLINAVVGDGEEPRSGVLRWGAMALGLAGLPLAVIAAVATGLRIGQYGFTPDRLWALVFVIIACAWGMAYLVALVRRRQGWAADVRPANLRLAFALCGLALLLATPIVSFNAISTRDQVARLESGRIAPDRFDWAALAFDFGEPGKAALARLKASRNAGIATAAQEASNKRNRYEVASVRKPSAARSELFRRLRILPRAVSLPHALIEQIDEMYVCGTDATYGTCTVLYTPGTVEAVAFQDRCATDLKRTGEHSEPMVSIFDPDDACALRRFRQDSGRWVAVTSAARSIPGLGEQERVKAALRAGKVSIRVVPRRQVFIGDTAIGAPFE